MATRINEVHKNQAYFITFTCYKFLSLIEMANSYKAFYNWFDYLKNKKVSILSFVIMPNHFHAVLFIPEECDKTINQLVSNGKRFIAYDIIKNLRTQENNILNTLHDGVTSKMAKSGNTHRVFITSFDCKNIFSEKMMLTKLDYIHNNPITGKWNLAVQKTDYKHSSAAFYELNEVNKWVVNYNHIF